MTDMDVIDRDPVSAEVVPFRRPMLPDLRNAATDSWTSVVEDVGTLAGRIADTEFVPKELRGNGAAVAACILAGREVGMPPMTALQTINVIKGRPAISAEGMRGLVLQAGHQIGVTESTASRVIIRGRRHGDTEWSTVSWTVDDARRAGLGGDNWKKYPRQMLTARATTELCRLIFADVVHGLRSVEEMSDALDELVEIPAAPEPTTTTVRRRGRPRKTAAPTEVENTAPQAEKPVTDAPADAAATSGRKRPELPSKTPQTSPEGKAADAPEDPQPEGPSVEQRQEEIRRLSEERRRLLDDRQADAVVASSPRAESTPDAPAGRTPKPPTLTAGQRASIMMHFARLDMANDRDERLWWTNRLLGLDPGTIKSANELTPDQAQTLLGALERYKDRDALETILQPTLTDPDPDDPA